VRFENLLWWNKTKSGKYLWEQALKNLICLRRLSKCEILPMIRVYTLPLPLSGCFPLAMQCCIHVSRRGGCMKGSKQSLPEGVLSLLMPGIALILLPCQQMSERVCEQVSNERDW